MVLVTGATGFVGSHLLRRMRSAGLPVRAMVRDSEKTQGLRELGVEIVVGDFSDKASLMSAATGVERVVHLVGIIQESPGATFQSVHVEGTKNLVAALKQAGVRHLVYQSALGARAQSPSRYHQTKWEAEELVRNSGIPYTIVRPSLIYGPGDQFTLRLVDMIRRSPVLPIIGSGSSKVQPLYIDDEVSCLIKTISSDAYLNEICEIGGPDQLTYEEVSRAIARALGAQRSVLHMPIFFMKPMVRAMEAMLVKPFLTTDQLIMLQEDNVCSMKDIRDAFEIEPIPFEQGLSRYIGKRMDNLN